MYRRVAIIGGGAAAAALLSELLERQLPQPLHLDWYTGGVNAPRGVAYGTRSDRHLLNVRAASMSMFAARPHGFLDFAQRGDGTIAGTDFLPRRLVAGLSHGAACGSWFRAGSYVKGSLSRRSAFRLSFVRERAGRGWSRFVVFVLVRLDAFERFALLGCRCESRLATVCGRQKGWLLMSVPRARLNREARNARQDSMTSDRLRPGQRGL